MSAVLYLLHSVRNEYVETSPLITYISKHHLAVCPVEVFIALVL